MKALLDACVLYPTVMREMLIGTARAGLYQPLWSPRILEEWAHTGRRFGAEVEAQARGEIAMLQANWPRSEVRLQPGQEDRFWLPDPADIHVLAAAVVGHADVIVTTNAKDFPQQVLAEDGLSRVDPDNFLLGYFQASPDPVRAVAEDVLATARRLSGEDWTMRALLKKARLPRLGKALA
ncbi:RSP_2648 family PIN domain-containing protein [Pseudooceanicola sp. LIPI14-2-Ac024]|uniref:RSP_2648 family PIN domain-containing protein n=1 Tax=Pseudooceanicola sp. LIPI14-2-Ac024 TaxID=3344875 RepID=UPI0035D126CC